MKLSSAGNCPGITPFVGTLAAVVGGTDLFNPYAPRHPGGELRAARLACYLRLMARRRPRLLLVGEAIGYRGGAVSGIPFTSLDVLHREPLLAPCAAPGDGDPAGPRREATATMVWEALGSAPAGGLPLLWNIVPFHPHRPGSRRSNRPPRRGEVRAGQDLLRLLLRLFPDLHPAAVGRHAQRGLREMGLAFTPLRHPSRGGKAAFIEGLAPLLALTRGD